MIFMVLCKYLNCVVDKTNCHTNSTDCNINYVIILLMMLFITSWCKPLKTDPFREMPLQ